MKSVLVFILVCIGSVSFGQTLERQVISSGGAFTSKSAGSLQYTVGESIVGELKKTSVVLTQGFDQAYKKTSVGIAPILPLSEFSVFPNPTVTSLHISPTQSGLCTIINTQGVEVLAHGGFTVGEEGITMDVSSLASGVYYVRYANSDGKVYRSKFLKAN